MVDLVERKVPEERKMGAANSFHLVHPLLYNCVVLPADPNWFCAAVVPLSSMLGFPLYEDTANGRVGTYHLYSFAIEVWFGANALTSKSNKKKLDSSIFGWLLVCLYAEILQNPPALPVQDNKSTCAGLSYDLLKTFQDFLQTISGLSQDLPASHAVRLYLFFPFSP